jgi:hypothetical protein
MHLLLQEIEMVLFNQSVQTIDQYSEVQLSH